MDTNQFKKNPSLELENIGPRFDESKPRSEKSGIELFPELEPNREQGREQPLEQGDASMVEKASPFRRQPRVQQQVAPTGAIKSEQLQKIEAVLEQDLEGIYFSMDPETQKKFKQRGEQVAVAIETLLQKARVKSRKIFKLIFAWLKIIPGVNKIFIKQAAKIKAARIIHLSK